MDDELWHAVEKIPGWLSRPEAEQLYELCNGPWCEVGSWKGRSTYVLASKHPGYAVDWFIGSEEHEDRENTLEEFLQNIEPVASAVTVLAMSFEEAVDCIHETFNLLFLDAEHTYEATKSSWDLYTPLLSIGGYVVIHDVWAYDGVPCPYPGVRQFAEEQFDNPKFVHVEDADRSAVFRKVSD